MGRSAEALAERVQSLGLVLHVERDEQRPFTVVLTRGTSSQRYAVTTTPRDLAGLDVKAPELPVLVWADHLSPRTAEVLRTLQAQYVTDSGNVWLEFGDVLIDIRGHARSGSPRGRRRVDGNPFTPAGSQVILAYLAWPELWDAPQRAVAQAAGVSLGQVNKTKAALQESGLAPEVPQARARLLEVWAATYPGGLGAKLVEAEYEGDRIDEVRGTRDSGPIEVSGELAVPTWLRPASATLYVSKPDPYLAVVNRWRVGENPNILVRRKFWVSPDAVATGSDEPRVAPWPLVYADLRASRDARTRDAAAVWRDQHV